MTAGAMDIVLEAAYRYPNLLLPTPAILFVIHRHGGFDDLTHQQITDSLRIAGAVVPSLRSVSESAIPQPSPLPMPGLAGEYVARTALALQREYLYPVGRASGITQSSKSRAGAVFEFRNHKLGTLAGRAAVSICALVFSQAEIQLKAVKAVYEQFRKDADAVVPNLGARFLLREAGLREIPAFSLFDSSPPVAAFNDTFQLGQGTKQVRYLNGCSSKTPLLACDIATQKAVGAQLFAEHGIPVPAQGLADTENEALEVAAKIGFPVVVKPNNQHKGVAVRTSISDEAELKKAFFNARRFGVVQIEKHIPGFDHRITFVRSKLVGVIRVMPASILGDGKTSIRKLLEAGWTTTPSMMRGKIIVDDEVLGHIRNSGYELDDVLPAAERIVLRRWWRNQADHALEDVTPSAHPENIEAARFAVELLGLEVAGVDFITTDITRPYRKTGGAIVEVNAMPILAGVQSCGLPAYRMLLESHFPNGDDGRIPTAVVLGTRDGRMTIDCAAAILAKCGLSVGIATKERLQVGGRPIGRTLPNDTARADLILRNPRSAVALLQTTENAVTQAGMPIDKCDIGVIMLPSQGIGNPGSAAGTQTASLLISIARKAVVLNCNDPRVSALLPISDGKRLIWILDELNAASGKHHRRGDAVVTIRQFDGQHFLSILEDQVIHKLAPVPTELVQIDSVATERRRAVLIASAIAHQFGAQIQDIADLVP